MCLGKITRKDMALSSRFGGAVESLLSEPQA